MHNKHDCLCSIINSYKWTVVCVTVITFHRDNKHWPLKQSKLSEMMILLDVCFIRKISYSVKKPVLPGISAF